MIKIFLKNIERGFTMIELIIVMAIFAVMTTLLLANYNTFGGNLLITNLAYDMALSIREAQTYGIGVKASGSGSGFGFQSGFGIHLENGTNNSYKLFADLNSNQVYDAGSDQIVKTYTFTQNNTLGGFCGKSASVTVCNSVSNPNLAITFKRPNPEATIKSGSTTFNSAWICVKSPQGRMKKVDISTSGQISVSAVEPIGGVSTCPTS